MQSSRSGSSGFGWDTMVGGFTAGAGDKAAGRFTGFSL